MFYVSGVSQEDQATISKDTRKLKKILQICRRLYFNFLPYIKDESEKADKTLWDDKT